MLRDSLDYDKISEKMQNGFKQKKQLSYVSKEVRITKSDLRIIWDFDE